MIFCSSFGAHFQLYLSPVFSSPIFLKLHFAFGAGCATRLAVGKEEEQEKKPHCPSKTFLPP